MGSRRRGRRRHRGERPIAGPPGDDLCRSRGSRVRSLEGGCHDAAPEPSTDVGRADPMKLVRLMLIAVAALGLVLVPRHTAASAATQNPSDIRCIGVQLAPAPLGSKPDLNPDGTPVKITA